MFRLQLYSTEHCSLCEQALDLLLCMPEMAGHELLVVDIARTDALMEQYGHRIPVLKAGERELCAPFGRAEIVAWLDTLAHLPGTRESAETK